MMEVGEKFGGSVVVGGQQFKAAEVLYGKYAYRHIALSLVMRFLSDVLSEGVRQMRVKYAKPVVVVTGDCLKISAEILGKNERSNSFRGYFQVGPEDDPFISGEFTVPAAPSSSSTGIAHRQDNTPVHLSSQDWGDTPFSGPAQQSAIWAAELGMCD